MASLSSSWDEGLNLGCSYEFGLKSGSDEGFHLTPAWTLTLGLV